MAKIKPAVVRCTDNLGRLVIPKEIRDILGLAAGEPVAMYFEEGKVVIEKYKQSCFLCGSFENIDVHLGDNCICRECAEAIAVKLQDLDDCGKKTVGDEEKD